jgi:hypothetical protein
MKILENRLWQLQLSCFLICIFIIQISNAQAQEKQPDKGRYITVTFHYDANDRIESETIKNVAGDLIVKGTYEYKGYNPMLKTKVVTVDVVNNKIIFEDDCDPFGKKVNPKYLIFDAEGNLIRKAGKPILAKSFKDAELWTEAETKYNGSFIVGKILKVYTCINCNCVKQTGIKNCKFIW